MPCESCRFLRRNCGVICFLVVLMSALPWGCIRAQSALESPYYARTNSFGIIAGYSSDSSHILLGVADRRKIWDLGGSYSRRLWAGQRVIWQYDGEIFPLAFEGDPGSREVVHQVLPKPITAIFDGGPVVSCAPSTQPFSFTDPKGIVYSGTIDEFCHGRQWTIGEAMSPVGFQWNFLPRRKIQPLLTSHVGYMYSSRPVPISFAGSFNFTFDVGTGIELYRTRTRSLRAEYRYHHLSNHNSASANPGVDSGIIQLSMVFGR